MSALVVILAAGKGERLRAGVPKGWVEVAGRPLLAHSLAVWSGLPWVGRIALVVDPGRLAAARRLVRREGRRRVAVVAGGRRRQDSVLRGVRRLSPGRRDLVMVHDAARPLVVPRVAAQVALATAHRGAALAAVPVTDTVKRAGAGLRVVATVPRDRLWLAQTPQGVRGDLVRAWCRALEGPTVTDDVAPLEAAGARVQLVPGDRRSLKVTVRQDLMLARRLLESGESRAGFGFDLHRLVRGRPLVLGGVMVPFARGLEGHSDADLVSHSVTDALLGATGGGDMGTRFGVRRRSTRGALSLDLLARAVRERAREGWRVRNADVTLLAQAPRLGRYRARIRRNLATVLGVRPERVSVKATTAKHTGAIGEGRAMACFALVTVMRNDETARGPAGPGRRMPRRPKPVQKP